MKTIPALNDGERWYVRLPRKCVVLEAEVISSTTSTVLLKIFDEDGMLPVLFGILPLDTQARYAIDDVDWIEKIEAGDE